jgi:hypothetical protein
MGIVIDSTAIASQLGDFFEKTVPGLAYEVRLAPDGEHLVWIERIPGGRREALRPRFGNGWMDALQGRVPVHSSDRVAALAARRT